jgi:serine/threonine-protein kinase/endoribonuclease IRE1
MRSHTGDIIQDLLYTRMVPNAVHRDLADYWSKNGHIKGEVFIRPGRKYGGYTGSFNAAKTKDQAGYQDRWRVEMLYDGTVAGILQEKGLRWVTNLGSVGVSVFDVLLPAAPGSRPILLPQPPAYLPTLFLEAQNNLQLMGLPLSALVHELPVAQEGDESIEEQGFFIMSSANHPLVGYAPRAQEGSLLGGHAVQEAVSERLPPLIDPAETVSVAIGEDARHLPEKKSLYENEPAREARPGWVARWKRGPDWLSLGLVGLLAMILLWVVTSARRQPANARPGATDTATNTEIYTKETSIAFDKALPAIPKDDEESRDSTITPPAEVADIQAANKKSNGRRRKRGKKNRGKRDDQGNEEDNDDGDLTEVEPLGEEGAQGEMVVAAPESGEKPEVKGHDVTQVDGLSVTDDVIGERLRIEDAYANLVDDIAELESIALIRLWLSWHCRLQRRVPRPGSRRQEVAAGLCIDRFTGSCFASG